MGLSAIPAIFRSEKSSLASLWLIGGLAIWWLCLVHLPWNYNGGWGTDLPFNLLACAFVCVVIAVCWVFLPARGIPLSSIGGLFLAGAILMTLPLLWSPSALARAITFPRVAGMWGGVLFYLTLRQCRISGRNTLLLASFLAMAGGIQATYTIVELFAPRSWLPEISQLLLDKYGRIGAGIFGQANVTSSFIAMALGAMLFLLGLRSAALISSKAEWIRRGALAAGIILSCVSLVLLKSRTGWLGGITVIGGIFILLRLSHFRFAGCHQRALLILPLIGILIGTWLMNVSPIETLREHAGSNHQRLLTLYHTLMMMKEHPLVGFGAGTYEAVYQDYVASLPGGNPGLEMMNHPHNEVLYQYAEGGIPALTGILIWGLAWLLLWRRARNVRQLGMLLCTLPVLLHSQFEFPFYYSVSHGMAVLQFVALAEQPEKLRQRSTEKSTERVGRGIVANVMLKLLIVFTMVYGAIVAWQSLRAAQVMDKFEASALSDPESITQLDVPWVVQPRFQHDLSLLRLIRFRTVPDTDSLRQFTVENAKWLSVYADDDMYRNQISVLNYLQDSQQAALWREKAEKMFPWKLQSFEQ
jgi:O-antigen polymerase